MILLSKNKNNKQINNSINSIVDTRPCAREGTRDLFLGREEGLHIFLLSLAHRYIITSYYQ